MFVLVQTSVGYFDVIVNLKSPFKPSEDFTCSLFLDDSKYELDQPPPSNTDATVANKELLCGPILFSSVVQENGMRGHFTLAAPEITTKKSLYVVVKFERVQREQTKDMTSSEATDFRISELLQDVYVGVYQFKTLPPLDVYFPGCRNVLLKDSMLHGKLVDLYLDKVSSSASKVEGQEISLILDIIVWIISNHMNASCKTR